MLTSVVDLDTLYLDPDPEFWSNLYPDPKVPINCEKNVINSLRGKHFLYNKSFF